MPCALAFLVCVVLWCCGVVPWVQTRKTQIKQSAQCQSGPTFQTRSRAKCGSATAETPLCANAPSLGARHKLNTPIASSRTTSPLQKGGRQPWTIYASRARDATWAWAVRLRSTTGSRAAKLLLLSLLLSLLWPQPPSRPRFLIRFGTTPTRLDTTTLQAA